MSVEQIVEAVKAGNEQQVSSLLATHPELTNTAGPQGESLVLLAIYYQHPELARNLVDRGAPVGINEAAALGALDRVKQFVAEDPKSVNQYARDGYFPLGLATFFGHREVARFLMESGADVNLAARNASHVTSLHAAAARHDLDIARHLLARGANPNARQQGGFTALHEAAAGGDEPLMQLLAEQGADLQARTDDDKSAYDLAVEKGKTAAAEWLRRRVVASGPGDSKAKR